MNIVGGYGTMEELLEMITWAQLGIHKKPVRQSRKPRNYDYHVRFKMRRIACLLCVIHYTGWLAKH